MLVGGVVSCVLVRVSGMCRGLLACLQQLETCGVGARSAPVCSLFPQRRGHLPAPFEPSGQGSIAQGGAVACRALAHRESADGAGLVGESRESHRCSCLFCVMQKWVVFTQEQ